jgi:hypothetical protein
MRHVSVLALTIVGIGVAACTRKETGAGATLTSSAAVPAPASVLAGSDASLTAGVAKLTPVQRDLLHQYELSLEAMRGARKPRMLVPRTLLSQAAVAVHRLMAAGVSRNMLIPDHVEIALDATHDDDGLMHQASVGEPVYRSYAEVRSLVYPQFWVPCIRVYKSVTFIGPAPVFDQNGTAQLTEVIYPLFPSPLLAMTTTINLTFTVAGDSERVDFTIVQGDELAVDSGDIIVQQFQSDPPGTDFAYVSIDKTITFKGHDALATIFELNQGALANNLSEWLSDAEQECGGGDDVTLFRRSP